MVGMGETYLPAFVLAIGMGQVAAGLIATVPLLAGAVLQLVSPAAVRRLGSHRRWVVACALCQALSFLPLCVAALVGGIPVAAVFLVSAIYWGSGMGTGPAWNTWVGAIVPSRIRPRYFARRTRMSQVCTLVGFLAGGASLQLGSQYQRPLLAFAVLFLTAAICRFISAGFLACQSEPEPPGRHHRDVPALEFVARFRDGGDGRLLVYLLSVTTAVQISGPYFTPYMLGPLGLSYAQYVTLIAVSFAAKIVALPIFGTLAQRFGARRLLWIGGLGIVPISLLWVFSDRFMYLFAVQILSGLTWAAYELAMFLLFFETIRPEERTSVLTTYNFANALATVLGSIVGGALLALLGKSPSSYLALFAVSCGARLLTLINLARLPRFSLAAQPLATRTLGMRATDGSLDQPVLSSLRDEATRVPAA